MRNHAHVSRRQLRTSNYSAEARIALGKAVEEARTAAGYKFRTDFARAHDIKNTRGLELLENGKTGVGQAFLFEVADALPNWTRETPRLILEGAPPPAVTAASDCAPVDDFPADWTEEEEQRYVVARETLHALKIRHRSEFTRTRWRTWRDEYDKLAEVERSKPHVTPGDRS